MNTKNNRLNRETDEKIIRAVYAMMTEEHRPIGKITVREICERSGVHRSTFYAHYRDVYDLVESVEKNMSRQLTEAFFRKLDEKASARECFTEVFAFIRDHRTFYTYYLSEAKSAGVLALTWETVRDRAAAAQSDLRFFGAFSPEEMAYHGYFFLSGMTAMVRLWLLGGCQEPPETLYDMICRQGDVQKMMIEW